MNINLFPFQKIATRDLRQKVAIALGDYYSYHNPQVVSLQAPTGAGKTIIMVSLVEDILYGTEKFEEQPNAIFIWLSDSPQLNEQSKNKFLKSNRISVSKCITVTDDSFDKEMFDDGKIYFINTQKISKSGNLCKHSDNRQYTIWETINNTAINKSDRLYFIIDEAHRGMQGTEAGKATSIMQRFIKGSPNHGLEKPVPLIIGISATSARFNSLVGDTTSTLRKVIVNPADVRSSGLLKDRIVITYPEDKQKNNEMAVLEAATDEWVNKTKHWNQYCVEQHYAKFNPIFVIQVRAGTGENISDNNLDDIIAKIEERTENKFKEHEVVHTFGAYTKLTINGLIVNHIEPNDIVDDKNVKVVLFKENLSTGWDCPRAETIMSFRHAEDATYIAQLLGRMVRTPLQSHIKVDDYLNDVRLYLPYFNRENVENVVNELQASEGGEIPTYIDQECIEMPTYKTYTVRISHQKQEPLATELTPTLFDNENSDNTNVTTNFSSNTEKIVGVQPTNKIIREYCEKAAETNGLVIKDDQKEKYSIPDLTLFGTAIDREGITKFINDLGLLTYVVRSVKINSYLKSLLDLINLLLHNNINKEAYDVVVSDILDMIKQYSVKLHEEKLYEKLAKEVLTFKLSVKVFDVFGKSIDNNSIGDLFTMSDTELDRQLRAADAKLGYFGLPYKYGKKYYNSENPDNYKIDCILFVINDKNIENLNNYAESKFHELNDKNRRYIVSSSEALQKEYSSIISNGDPVSEHNFTLPVEIQVPEDVSGKSYSNHLFVDEKTGIAKIKLNSWEEGVIEEESRRDDFVCWLRNPSRGTWALTIPYEINNEIKPTYPDFIIVRRDEKTGYVLDILEPHDPTRNDNLPKAKGFAKYAKEEPKIGRLQLIRKMKDSIGKEKFVRLDFSKGEIRDAVLKMQTQDELDHLFEILE